MSLTLASDPVQDIVGSIQRSLGAADGRISPFLHWRAHDVLPESAALAIAALPFAPLAHGGISGRRELHNAQRRYFAGPTLSQRPAARRIAEAFQAAPVVAVLAALTGVALTGAWLRIEYALDVDGFWLEPHTDLGVKLLTIFLQLAGPGQADLGTDLYAGPAVWAERTPFGWNAALIFAPSDCSWHGFAPRTIPGVRRSLIVNYVTDAWRAREQLAFPDRPVRAGLA
jgi:hypothetical protein